MKSPAHADRARTLTKVRRAGYRLLPGDSFSYLLHMRPMQWPVMALDFTIGFAGAAGGRAPGTDIAWGHYALGVTVWSVLLFGGTLALNSAFDRDTGDVGGLIAPPQPPPGLATFGAGLMLLGGVITLRFLSIAEVVIYAACAILSVLYSVPPVRLKTVPGMAVVVNVFGFGVAAPYAGWAITGRPVDQSGIILISATGALMTALYPLTQLYQLDEDAARGDVTFARRWGMKSAFRLSLVASVAAFSFLANALVPARGVVGAIALAMAGSLWARALIPWYFHYAHLSSRQHQLNLYRMGHAWVATAACTIVALLWTPR